MPHQEADYAIEVPVKHHRQVTGTVGPPMLPGASSTQTCGPDSLKFHFLATVFEIGLLRGITIWMAFNAPKALD